MASDEQPEAGSRPDAPGRGRHSSAASQRTVTRDRELMARIALREPAALADLYDRHHAAVYGVCAKVLGPGADAEDVLEEVFFEAWQRPTRYDETRSAPLSYLAVIARSRSIDRIRSGRRRADAMERNRNLEPVPDFKDPLDTAVASEERVRAREALALLRPDEREVVTLFYWSGLTHAEIAERQQLPLGTVKTRIRRGLLRLREALTSPHLETNE